MKITGGKAETVGKSHKNFCPIFKLLKPITTARNITVTYQFFLDAVLSSKDFITLDKYEKLGIEIQTGEMGFLALKLGNGHLPCFRVYCKE